MKAGTALVQLRVDAILAAKPDWPCRKGCDHCCRHLADVPQLTAGEWLSLREVLTPELESRIRAMSRTRPIMCPLLDEATGACLVYQRRPLACRAYGFYIERGQGLYCGIIESRSDLDDVVWGNWESVQPGETKDLVWWVESGAPRSSE